MKALGVSFSTFPPLNLPPPSPSPPSFPPPNTQETTRLLVPQNGKVILSPADYKEVALTPAET